MNISLLDISENIWFNELNETTETSIVKILKWLQFHIGDLNDLIQTSYEQNGNDVTPQLTYESAVVFASMFMDYWYGNQVRINSGANAFTDWIEVKEADTTFRKVNRNEIAKTVLQLKAQNKEYLMDLINAYKRNQCIPANLQTGLWGSICGCH